MTIREYFESQSWTFAKTYVMFAPHEYIIRSKVADKEMFDNAVRYIQDNGIRMFYYTAERKYLFVNGWFYWALWSKEDFSDAIINRCRPDDYDIVFVKRGTQAKKAQQKLEEQQEKLARAEARKKKQEQKNQCVQQELNFS